MSVYWIILFVVIVYAEICGIYGANPKAPLWLRWPIPVWNFIAHDWRRPKD